MRMTRHGPEAWSKKFILGSKVKFFSSVKFRVTKGNVQSIHVQQIRPQTMSRSLLLLLLVLFFIILIFVLAFYGFFTPKGNTPNIAAQIAEYESESGWQNTGAPGPCMIYTFPPTFVGGQPVPPNPTYDPATLANTPSAPLTGFTCLDTDQLALQTQTQTCTSNGSNPNGCFQNDGTVTPIGGTRTIVNPCDNLQACPGAIALLSLGFNETLGASNLCLTTPANPSAGSPVTVTQCNLQDPNSFFQVNQADPVTLAVDAGGPYAQFIHRSTGLCMVPDVSTQQIQLGACNVNGGYNWLLAPSVQIPQTGTTTPAQLVYTTSAPQLPPVSEIATSIANSSSMVIDSCTNDVILAGFALDETQVGQTCPPGGVSQELYYLYSSQIIQIPLYDIILNSPNTGAGGFPYFAWPT